MQNPILFLHITKTAGGTLKSAIKASLKENALLANGVKDVCRDYTPGQHEVIFGHFGFGIHVPLGVAPRYMAFLRHPILRTISHYYHLRNVDKSRIGDLIRQSTDINDFFERFSHWEFNDFQCRVLSGKMDAKIEAGRADHLHKLARTNLETYFEFCGIQEFFDLSVRSLGNALHRQLKIVKNVNLGTYDIAAISDLTFDRIIRLNVQDMRLYNRQVGKFVGSLSPAEPAAPSQISGQLPAAAG